MALDGILGIFRLKRNFAKLSPMTWFFFIAVILIVLGIIIPYPLLIWIGLFIIFIYLIYFLMWIINP